MNILKKVYINLINYLITTKVVFNSLFNKSIKSFWFDDANNFGDILTPYLFELIGDKKVVKINTKYYPFKNHITIGSILSLSNNNSIIWGAGFISKDSVFKYGKPKKIMAVRGPKTRKRVLELGVDCPEVYGDPALLLPKFYKPKNTEGKSYKIGVIPHYMDKDHSWLTNFKDNKEVLIIDIQNNNIFDFVEQVNTCEKIVSSSLHGIIVADAYSIPSLWIEFSQNVKGNGFKFLDYFESVKRAKVKPVKITNDTSIDFLLDNFLNYKIDIYLDKLMDSCPFST